MLIEPASAGRNLNFKRLDADLTIVGGGMAGCCCAITAARAGLKVTLIQDRPVLGGNASSEVRLYVLGATFHSGSDNRWAREGGVINEILTENLWRNPEGNPVIFDTVVLEKVITEKNITLLLNTSCFEVTKDTANPDRVASVKAFCSQNSTLYEAHSPLFCDASGDGVVGFLAGAAFRMGAESKDEFGEGFAPTGDFGHLLGHSIYFYSKDAGRPVNFVPPSYALIDVEGAIPRYRHFSTKTHGTHLWWIEYGGRLDTVHETEEIKWELWKVVYGVWNYIKNSGKFPDAANLTLEWVGQIPGKRESRRFEGDYILKQQDIVERPLHPDAVAYGGWSIDLHPADGVFAKSSGSHHLHSKGVYQIPYRCYYSRNIENLFLAGRIISTTHVAFGSARVISTCALGGQVVGTAAAICKKYGELPRQIGNRIPELQRNLLRSGHFIPGVTVPDPDDLVFRAKLTASSTFRLASLPPDGPSLPLPAKPIPPKPKASDGPALYNNQASGAVPSRLVVAQLIPLPAGPIPELAFWVDADQAASVEVELRTTSETRHQAPDVTLDSQALLLEAGKAQKLWIRSPAIMPQAGYLFVIFKECPGIRLLTSKLRVSGLVRLRHKHVADYLAIGGEKFDSFCLDGKDANPSGPDNLAFSVHPPIDLFGPENIRNGWLRPIAQPNAWIADPSDEQPFLHLTWSNPQKIISVEIHFDGNFEHTMESVLVGHSQRVTAFGVKRYEILDDKNQVLHEANDCHHALENLRFQSPVETTALTIKVLETWGALPAIFEVRCYS